MQSWGQQRCDILHHNHRSTRNFSVVHRSQTLAKYSMLSSTDSRKDLSTWKDIFVWISSVFDNEASKANESAM
jgi:hypothetical protein